MTQTHSNLWLYSITEEQHQKTCGYWYLVHSDHRSFKAFATRSALYKWLEDRNLEIDDFKLAPHGEFSSQKIQGQFIERMTMDAQEFNNMQGVIRETRQLSNGEYTLGKITKDKAGVRIVNFLNCNVRNRVVFPYFESDAIYCGRVDAYTAPQLDKNLQAIGRPVRQA